MLCHQFNSCFNYHSRGHALDALQDVTNVTTEEPASNRTADEYGSKLTRMTYFTDCRILVCLQTILLWHVYRLFHVDMFTGCLILAYFHVGMFTGCPIQAGCPIIVCLRTAPCWHVYRLSDVDMFLQAVPLWHVYRLSHVDMFIGCPILTCLQGFPR